MRPAPKPRTAAAVPPGRVLPLLAGVLLLLLALSACGAPSSTASSAGARVLPAMPAPTGASPKNVPQAARAAGAPVAGAAVAQGVAVTNQISPLPSLPAGQMLIRSGQIDLEAKDPAALVDQVRQIAAAAVAGSDAGYVADERLQSSNSTFTASITINVPASSFTAVMQQLRSLGSKVLNETSSSQDVTEQYVDVDAQLQALRATQAQLLQLLSKTQQVSDTLAVQRELSNVDTQINQLEGRENYLKAHSAFSTIVVTIQPPTAVAPTPQAGWNPVHAVMSAIAALGVVGQGVVDALIWLLVFGVPLAALALVALAIQRAVARTLRSRRSSPKTA
jgi:hypothetical protein